MPYKLSEKGFSYLHPKKLEDAQLGLTDLQNKALDYLNAFQTVDTPYIESSEIARYYGLAPQAMRGPLHGLWLKNLVEKEE